MRISGKIFQSRFAQKLSIKVCLKIFNQGSIDPDQFFNRDPVRYEIISSKVWLKKIQLKSEQKFSIRIRFIRITFSIMTMIASEKDFSQSPMKFFHGAMCLTRLSGKIAVPHQKPHGQSHAIPQTFFCDYHAWGFRGSGRALTR
ncbi:MAG: hypothetical protein Q7U51_08305 [Methanoregula sp.]|nr:hypothetical protein [Methanoregula sp.]